jgi:hypothetical protein
MTQQEAFHTAARRYCLERASTWRKRYAEGGYGSNDPAGQAIYPRYNTVEAILLEIERISGSDLASLEEARDFLVRAGQTAHSPFTEAPQSAVALQAMNEERDRFHEYVGKLTEHDIGKIEPLPYRRTLSLEESEALWTRVAERWGTDGGYWHPLRMEEAPADIIAFNADAFHEEVPLSSLHQILATQRIARLWELREYGPEHEIDLALFEPFYNGAEGYWTSNGAEWLIYASHESSITFAGEWLVDRIKRAWPTWRECLYRGWASN